MIKRVVSLINVFFGFIFYSQSQEGNQFSLYFYTPEKNYCYEIYKYKSNESKFLLLKIDHPIQDPYRLILDTDSAFEVWMRAKHKFIPFCRSWIHISSRYEPQKKPFIYFDGTRKRKYRYQVRWLDADFEKKKLR